MLLKLITLSFLVAITSGCTRIDVMRDAQPADVAASGFRGVRMVTYTQESFPPTGLFWRREAELRADYTASALRASGFFSEVHSVALPPTAGLHLHINTDVGSRRGWSGNLFNGLLSLASAGLVPYRVPRHYAHDVTVYRNGRVIERRTYAQGSTIYNGVLLGVLTVPLLGDSPERATAVHTRNLIDAVLLDIQRTGVLREPLP